MPCRQYEALVGFGKAYPGSPTGPQDTEVGDSTRQLGPRLTAPRELRGLKVRELARLADVDHQAISNLESGRTENPTLKTLLAIQRALGLPSIELLLGGVAEHPSWAMATAEAEGDVRGSASA